MVRICVDTALPQLTDNRRIQLTNALPSSVRTRMAHHTQSARDTALLAYTALGQMVETHIFASLTFSANGQPQFAPEHQLFCSVSHTDGAIAVGIANTPLGVDIQVIVPCKEAVVRRVFTQEEQVILSHATARDRVFTTLWTKREAALKYSGKGLSALHAPLPSTGVYTVAEYPHHILTVYANEPAHISAAKF